MGSHEDRPEDQGITILGTPVGRQEFVEQEIAKIIADHSELLTRIPSVQDLQCAWLLLLYCGETRANFYIRTIRPELTANFARSHDDQIWHCFCRLLRIRRSGAQCEGSHKSATCCRRVGVEKRVQVAGSGTLG